MIRKTFPEKGFRLTEKDFESIITQFEKDSGKQYEQSFLETRKSSQISKKNQYLPLKDRQAKQQILQIFKEQQAANIYPTSKNVTQDPRIGKLSRDSIKKFSPNRREAMSS